MRRLIPIKGIPLPATAERFPFNAILDSTRIEAYDPTPPPDLERRRILSGGARAVPILALLLVVTPQANCSPPKNPWTVVAVRERRPGEVPFEVSSRYLWPSPDLNNVPGPDSLVARVRIDEEHRPHLEVEDLRTRQVRSLIDGYGSQPNWSPDGKYISCVVWKSMRQPHELMIVDAARKMDPIDPGLEASATIMKWSPDSRTLAAYGVMYGRPWTMMYTVSVPDRRTEVLDSLEILGDYQFSWSPDGRWIAFSRPTGLDPLSEDPTAADLWIVEAATRNKWPMLSTPDWVESNPLWITNRTIQLDRVRWDGNQLGLEQRVILDLSMEDSLDTSH